MNIEINEDGLRELAQLLGDRLYQGCEDGAEIIKQTTPIDTQRLYESTRADNLEINNTHVSCRVVVGGVEMYGVRREQNILKDVDYAAEVELRYGYMQGAIADVEGAIAQRLQGR
ncbi:MAG: hypothetical protein KatS3mg087_0551 [Patescibacteria group bacterium]|nr:MAG: hypothetical protein KatS3mg087_0551 [Patescibacteria group bacterium]